MSQTRFTYLPGKELLNFPPVIRREMEHNRDAGQGAIKWLRGFMLPRGITGFNIFYFLQYKASLF
jgi:hypothetical protein